MQQRKNQNRTTFAKVTIKKIKAADFLCDTVYIAAEMRNLDLCITEA